MRYTIVFNHPYEKSFCNAILDVVCNGLKKAGHSTDVIHLDKEKFDPVMTTEDLQAFRDNDPRDPQVLAYKKRLDETDFLIFIFPIWWELMPALTKGFIDRVIFPGLAYRYSNANKTKMKPLLHIKGVTVITTMNTPGLLYTLVFGNAIKMALLRGTFWKLGYKNRKWISFNKVKSASEDQRKKWLQKLEYDFLCK